VIFNAHHESLEYKLPEKIYSKKWKIVMDTSNDEIHEQTLNKEESIAVEGRSIVLLHHPLT
jgi:glycogen operon protein